MILHGFIMFYHVLSLGFIDDQCLGLRGILEETMGYPTNYAKYGESNADFSLQPTRSLEATKWDMGIGQDL